MGRRAYPWRWNAARIIILRIQELYTREAGPRRRSPPRLVDLARFGHGVAEIVPPEAASRAAAERKADGKKEKQPPEHVPVPWVAGMIAETSRGLYRKT
jgi:hypothetical protein